MLKRMLHITGGLLAVAALAVAPSAAGADTSATAKLAGGGGGCSDDWPPNSNWGNGGWNGNGGNWNGWGDGNGYFGGNSSDSSCDADDRKGKVARVMVAVERRRGGDTRQRLSRSGRLGSRTDSSRLNWMPAQGTSHWHKRISHRLPQGNYVLHHRAIDAAGNRGRRHNLHLSIG